MIYPVEQLEVAVEIMLSDFLILISWKLDLIKNFAYENS